MIYKREVLDVELIAKSSKQSEANLIAAAIFNSGKKRKHYKKGEVLSGCKWIESLR